MEWFSYSPIFSEEPLRQLWLGTPNHNCRNILFLRDFRALLFKLFS